VKHLVTALAILALTAPVAQAAQRPKDLAPPGDSAVSQYLETVPTDMGGTPPRSGGTASNVLPPSESRRLDQSGAAGRTLVAIVAASAPPAPPAPHRAASTRKADRGSSSGSDQASLGDQLVGSGLPTSPLSAFVAASTGRDGGGAGILLPLVLLATALLIGVAVVRRRGAQRP
jgi:hypothetical protein